MLRSLISYLIEQKWLISIHQRLILLIRTLIPRRTFRHICTVLQQSVSSPGPRSNPIRGRELLTIGYLPALPSPTFGRVMDSLPQVFK